MEEKKTGSLSESAVRFLTRWFKILIGKLSDRWYVVNRYAARIRLSLRVSAIARFQMKPVMAFFICGNTLLFFSFLFFESIVKKA